MKPTKLFFRLLFCTFIGNVFFMNAQQTNPECVVIENNQTDPVGTFSYSTDMETLNNCDPIVFNVKFWGIKHPDGNVYFPNRYHDALQSIANLNILYNKFGIYFKFRGYDDIQSPALPNDPDGYFVLQTTSQYSAMVSWATTNGYKDVNSLNVYAFGWAPWGGGIANMPGTTCAVNSAGLGNLITTHEISHNLYLGHTRSANEHTTRDPLNQYFNATFAGDQVVDTAANSGFYHSSCSCTLYIDPTDCTYFGTETDNSPDHKEYEIYHIDVINIMGDAYGCSEQSLTTGQAIRVREKVDTGFYDAVLTDIASLYEPYAGEYFYSSTQGSPTNYKPLFQPGFDYRFVECSCDCPLPSDYYDTSFSYTNNALLTISKYETDYSIITHPNHSAIHIDLLSPCIASGQNTRRCYDNYNRRPKDGSITLFNDGVLNGNVTVTQKDSLGINQPTLIEDLNPGLYKVEKNYEDGEIEQNIIFKGN